MRRVQSRIVGPLAVVLLLAGCGGDQQQAGASRGQALFEANCSACHGPQGQGTDQGPPLVDVVYEPSHHPDEAFRSAVANGVTPHHWDFGPMPAIPSLDEAQVDAIIGYVRGLQRDAGIE
jgi:mono/diheme cytochrome c family protein